MAKTKNIYWENKNSVKTNINTLLLTMHEIWWLNLD